MSETPEKRPDLGLASAPALSGAETPAATPSDTPPAGAAPTTYRAPLPFDVATAERYARGHVLGVGGMGRVVQAFDKRLSREVALKEVITREHGLRGELEDRLAREASVTARLEHPGIVPVHDAGRLSDGTPFYTMRIVRGRSLATAIPEARDPVARRQLLRHVLDACQAVGWAHRHGVIHRDLKPANIMVGEFGETQVVDWGLASAMPTRASNAEAPDDENALTRFGAVLGTPRYMSPEQARAEPATARSDVWSLGCVLHEVVTGLAAVSDGSSAEVLERVKLGVTIPAESWPTEVPFELRAIIRRALDPDPARRYADAKALAEDLARYLDGERVVAHDYTAWELVVRLARAWKKPLIVAAVALVALIVFVVFSFDRIDAERELAETAEGRATLAADLARRSEERAIAALERSDEALASALTGEAIQRSRKDGRPEAEVLAAHALALRDLPEAMGVLMSWTTMRPPELVARVPRPEGCLEVSIAPDGAALACRGRGVLALYQIEPPLGPGSRLVKRWSVAHDGRGAALVHDSVATGDPRTQIARFSLRDGARLDDPTLTCCALPTRSTSNGRVPWVVGGGRLAAIVDDVGLELRRCSSDEEVAGTVDETGTLWAQSCRDGAVFVGPIGGQLREIQTGFGFGQNGLAPATALAFTRDQRGLLMADTVGALALVDLGTGPETATTRFRVDTGLGMPRQIATSPDGRFAAILGERVGVKILDLQTGQWRGALPRGDIRGLAFLETTDSELVTFGEELRRWRLTDGPLSSVELSDGITSIAIDPRDALAPVLAVTRGKGLTVTDLEGRFRFDGALHDRIVKGGAFTRDGSRYGATAGATHLATRFDAGTWERLPNEVPLAAPGREIAVLSRAGRADVWVDLTHNCGVPVTFGDDTASHGFILDTCHITDLARSPSGRFLAMLQPLEGEVWLLDAEAELTLIGHPLSREATTIAIGDDGETLVAAEPEAVTAWSLGPLPHMRHLYPARGATFLAVALSEHGRFIAAGARDGSTWLWERDSGQLRARMRDHEQRVSAVTFFGEALLLTGSWDWSVRARALATLERPRTEWVRLVENRWGLTLDEVLARPSD